MKLPIQEPIKINEGRHTGAIIAVEYREKPFRYTDVVMEFKELGKEFKLKVGYPTVVSSGSKLGKLLARFGAKLTPGKEIDPDKLIGMKCIFQTINEETSKGTFAKVVQDSLKPLEG